MTNTTPIFSNSQWKTLIDTTFAEITKLAELKGGEYSGDVDRLNNFRKQVAKLEIPMETVWAIYAGKHWDALLQYILDLQKNKSRPRLEPISGRIDDLLVYLLLFKCMVQERERQPVVPEPGSYQLMENPKFPSFEL